MRNSDRVKKFAMAAGVRAVRTACQTFIAVAGTGAVIISDVNWAYVLSASALSAVLSVVTSIATGLPEV